MMTRDEVTDIANLIAELRDEPCLANDEEQNHTVQLTLNVLAIRLGTLFYSRPVTYYDRRQWHRLCGFRSLNDIAGDKPSAEITGDEDEEFCAGLAGRAGRAG